MPSSVKPSLSPLPQPPFTPASRCRTRAGGAPGIRHSVRETAHRGIVVLAICTGVATANGAAGAQGRPDSAVAGGGDSLAAGSNTARGGPSGGSSASDSQRDSARVREFSLLPEALTTGSHLYELLPDESDDIRSAIDVSVAHMNFIIRPIARRRLVKANRPADQLSFDVQSDTLAVTFGDMNPILTPLSGDSTPWKRGGTHEWYQVHTVLGGDTVRQIIKTDDGQRENDFEFLDDGARLALHVILTADRLPIPLRYTLLYRRVY